MTESGAKTPAFFYEALNSMLALKGIIKIIGPKGIIYINESIHIAVSQRVSDTLIILITSYN